MGEDKRPESVPSPNCKDARNENAGDETRESINSPMDTNNHNKRLGFDVGERYRVLRTIGAGAYGAVCCALDLRTGGLVAIKKIPSIFTDTKETKRAVREVRLLIHFRKQENILQILDLFYGTADDAESFQDIYIVTEYVQGGDAASFCQNKEKMASMSDDRKLALFMYSLLKGLAALHSAGVLHRDLRPKNILINDNKLKICDLGAGRAQQVFTKKIDIRFSLLSYVSSLYYTAPEALLPNTNYTSTVDIWAAGCVMAEFLLGSTLFREGGTFKSNLDQFKFITDTIGFDMDADAINRFNPQERFRTFLRELPIKPSRLADRFYKVPLSEEAFDLLHNLLLLQPEKRITAVDALRHPWFDGLRDEEDVESQVGIFNGDDIEAVSTREELRDLLLASIHSFARPNQ